MPVIHILSFASCRNLAQTDLAQKGTLCHRTGTAGVAWYLGRAPGQPCLQLSRLWGRPHWQAGHPLQRKSSSQQAAAGLPSPGWQSSWRNLLPWSQQWSWPSGHFQRQAGVGGGQPCPNPETEIEEGEAPPGKGIRETMQARTKQGTSVSACGVQEEGGTHACTHTYHTHSYTHIHMHVEYQPSLSSSGWETRFEISDREYIRIKRPLQIRDNALMSQECLEYIVTSCLM